MELKDFFAPGMAFVGVIVGAATAIAKDVYLQCWKDKGALKYLVVMVVFALDKYVNDAAAVVMDDGEPDLDDQYHSRSPVAELPTFKPEDIKVEWTVLSPELTYRVFNLGPQTAHAVGAIDYEAEQASAPNYPEVFEERQVQFAELGLAAAELADDLRRLVNLPGYKLSGNWNPVAVMQTRRTELFELRRKRAERERLNPDD